MIASIDGKLTYKSPAYIIIEVGGIGYQVKISLSTYSQLEEGERCKLHTHLHIKEDAHTLYGFKDPLEKKLFLDLISISGVGPATALIVLSSISVLEFHQAIVDEDVKTIQSIKGIGPKTAQRIILELKDKFKKEEIPLENHQVSMHTKVRSEALAALLTLGIPKLAAEKNIDKILKENSEIKLEELVKQALKFS